MDKYDHRKIEPKWQKRWEEEKIYSPDIQSGQNKFYNLWMFPYPSAEGLHAGHAFASTGSDVIGRFMRMQGKNVFQPIGYDSFGIHSENYAIKIGEDPHEVVKRTTKNYEKQMKSLGHGYDWTKTVTTSDPDYYKWTQWLFIQMFKKGLAYKKKAEVNFCPSCKTVLADEQVMSPKSAGKEAKNAQGEVIQNPSEDIKVCERCGTVAEKKELEQWFFEITKYADRLLSNLEKIDWTNKVKLAQKNWIGKSDGVIINFKKADGTDLPVFTTRPDTLNAVTFIAIADEKLYNKGQKEKLGEFTNDYAINPLDGRKVPIWKTNYVAPGYGTGNVMGVPAHDERDAEFATKYHIDILNIPPKENNFGEKHTNYHLRDWLVSRQRYWGAPIPMIYCKKCAEGRVLPLNSPAAIPPGINSGAPSTGLPVFASPASYSLADMSGWYPVPEVDLPVLLPAIKDFKPEGTGRGPLANHPDFYNTKCPNCGGEATRETDVMDTFVDSSWYFLRYPSAHSGQVPFDKEITKTWLPVDLYFGGAEHSVLHLMYARFVWMVLKDLGYFDFSAQGGPASGWDEPFPKFFAHGLMIKDGAKMSKSRGNVVNPDEYVEKFGADTLRLYEMFLGPMDGSPDFRDSGIEGMQRFINRLWKIFCSHSGGTCEDQVLAKTWSYEEVVASDLPTSASGDEVQSSLISKVHQTIKKVTEDIQEYKYNTAIASIMELVNVLSEYKVLSTEYLETLALLLAPFIPHFAEEVWTEILGQPFSVHTANWPKYDDSLIYKDTLNITVQVNGKVRAQIRINKSTNTQIYKSDKTQSEIEQIVKEDTNVKKWIEGKEIKNVIYVQGRLINFVI